MDQASVDRIRNASFSQAVRGYDRREVDRFLSELADWLEDGDVDEAIADAVRSELERIGEQTANILTEAHDAAQSIRDGAQQEIRQTMVDANLRSESLRANADEYAEQTRDEAEAYARKARGGADAYAKKTRAEADAYAKGIREEADSALEQARTEGAREAKRIAEDAARRKRDIEAVISDLEERRDAVLNELERLASGLAGTATQHRSGPAGGERTAEEPAAMPRPAQKSR